MSVIWVGHWVGGPTEFRQRLESEAQASAAATYDTDTAALQVAVYTM